MSYALRRRIDRERRLVFRCNCGGWRYWSNPCTVCRTLTARRLRDA